MSDTKTLALIIITQEDKIEEQAKELYRLDLANGNLTEFKETAKLANKNLYEENAKLEEDRDEWKSVSEGKLLGVLNENKELRDEIATNEEVMRIIFGHCGESGTSIADHGDPSTRVEMLKDAYRINTLDLNALRLHLGKSKRGCELLKQFDRAKTDK